MKVLRKIIIVFVILLPSNLFCQNFSLDGINDFLILNPDFPSKNILNCLGNQYCFDWK